MSLFDGLPVKLKITNPNYCVKIISKRALVNILDTYGKGKLLDIGCGSGEKKYLFLVVALLQAWTILNHFMINQVSILLALLIISKKIIAVLTRFYAQPL